MTDAEVDATMSKSDRIRDYLRQNPGAKPKEITEALSQYTISYQLIVKVSNEWRQKQKTARHQSPVSSITGGTSLDVSVMDQGIRFAEACGGLEKAREILDVIERIWESKTLTTQG